MEIEKNIPIPKAIQVGRRSKYPFDDMEIGDSFAVDKSEVARVRASATNHNCKPGKNFEKRHFGVLKLEDGSYRCWRTK